MAILLAVLYLAPVVSIAFALVACIALAFLFARELRETAPRRGIAPRYQPHGA